MLVATHVNQVPWQFAPFAGSGPADGIGGNRSEQRYAGFAEVAGTPSLVHTAIFIAPPIPYHIAAANYALPVQPVRVPALDLQSHAPAPPVPLNSAPRGTVVLQINGPVMDTTLINLSSPRIPTGGAAPCQPSRSY